MIARRWFLLVITVVLSFGYAAYRAYSSPNIYQATSGIQVKGKIMAGGQNSAVYLEELNFFYDSQIRYMESRDVLRRVESKLKSFDPPVTFPAILKPSAVKGK